MHVGLTNNEYTKLLKWRSEEKNKGFGKAGTSITAACSLNFTWFILFADARAMRKLINHSFRFQYIELQSYDNVNHVRMQFFGTR